MSDAVVSPSTSRKCGKSRATQFYVFYTVLRFCSHIPADLGETESDNRVYRTQLPRLRADE